MDFSSSIRLRSATVIAACLVFTLPFSRGNEAPRFVDPQDEANEGTILLEWKTNLESVENFELEQAEAATFDPRKTFSTGVHTSRYITGLREGEHFFRVRQTPVGGEPSAWSPVISVSVNYVQSWKVWTLMAAGLVTFAMTVGAIVVGQKRATKLRGGSAS